MNAVEIEDAISELCEQQFDAAEFPFAFLEAFGNPETTIKRLRKGESNRTDVDRAVLQRSNIHILVTDTDGVEDGLKALRESPKTTQQKAKFILATDGEELQAEELGSGEVLACKLVDLPKHFGFLLPLAGISTVEEIKNNPIDIKATGRLDKLYVALLEKNPEWAKQENREDFNHFMAQLIFCFFAEDTGIFNGEGLFTETVRQMSESDGSNTQEIITAIFAAMNFDPRIGGRKGVRPYADQFPYVNGGLFGGEVKVPVFSRIARTYLLRAGELDWTAINPDIFGSMIQAVADDEERGELGMHYTSVPNILKVLNPLFLDNLNEDLEKAGNNKQQLGKLKKRIARIRVFDPACGSGNFLVIAYKHMREIEHKANVAGGWGEQKSVIPLTNFRGIEIKSFAAEIARLALIIAEYQCDEIYIGQREALALFLPLEKQNWITRGNALQLDWLSICPPTGETSIKLQGDDLFNTPLDQSEIDFENEGGETYICGNPPFSGVTKQSTEQKRDIKHVFAGTGVSSASLDYVACWYARALNYQDNEIAPFAFVSTNSFCQGQSVTKFWPLVLRAGFKVAFARTSFYWKNLAAKNAGVIAIIVGLNRADLVQRAKLYNETSYKECADISPYLVGFETPIVMEIQVPLHDLPQLIRGSIPNDDQNFLMDLNDKNEFLRECNYARSWIKRYVGAQEISKGITRYALVLPNDYENSVRTNDSVMRRVEAVEIARSKSTKKSTREVLSKTPHKYELLSSSAKVSSTVVSRTTTVTRPFLAADILPSGHMANDNSFFTEEANLVVFSLLSSKLHLTWIATVCGRMKNDYRYANTLGWNTFPVPKLTSRHKEDLTRTAENILLAREAHFPAPIADLYKPDEMPDNLRAAHDENDRILEEIYVGRRFKNDTERLETLFEMYTEMTTKAKVA